MIGPARQRPEPRHAEEEATPQSPAPASEQKSDDPEDDEPDPILSVTI